MPDELKFEGDKAFFTAALDRADLILHGRNSYEDQPNSPRRRRIILTRKVEAIAPDPANPKSTLWNPAGASFDAACKHAGMTSGTVAVIGGPGVFGMFMDRYDDSGSRSRRTSACPAASPASPVSLPDRHSKSSRRTACTPANRRCLMRPNEVSVTPWRRST